MVLLKQWRKIVKKALTSLIISFIYIYSYIKWTLPYNKAKMCIAYQIYMDTPMYRERAISFGKEFAFQLFINNREHVFFLKKLTFFDKIGAAIIPFSYIDAQKGEQYK